MIGLSSQRLLANFVQVREAFEASQLSTIPSNREEVLAKGHHHEATQGTETPGGGVFLGTYPNSTMD